MYVKSVMLVLLAVVSASLHAMPTKDELDSASPAVLNLMKPEQDALKAGQKSRTEVASAAIALANRSSSEAVKLLLLKGALNLYVRDGDFDEAVKILGVIETAIPDIPPQVIANIIESALRNVPQKNGGQLYRLLEEAKAMSRFECFKGDDLLAGVSNRQCMTSAHVFKDSLYMVVDLMARRGEDPIAYLDAVPVGGWSDEYKTSKLVMRRIEPGEFEHTTGVCYRISKPFYIGVFEVTEMQFGLITGDDAKSNRGDTFPVIKVSYQDIRGKNLGMGWPSSDEVDADSVLGRLRTRYGIRFELPTEVQWEYACRAGIKDASVMNGEAQLKYGKLVENGGEYVKVGSFKPNDWGVYDMIGNAQEWCADCIGSGREWPIWRKSDFNGVEVDYKGRPFGKWRMARGLMIGHKAAKENGITFRRGHDPAFNHWMMGFRLCAVNTSGGHTVQ